MWCEFLLGHRGGTQEFQKVANYSINLVTWRKHCGQCTVTRHHCTIKICASRVNLWQKIIQYASGKFTYFFIWFFEDCVVTPFLQCEDLCIYNWLHCRHLPRTQTDLLGYIETEITVIPIVHIFNLIFVCTFATWKLKLFVLKILLAFNNLKIQILNLFTLPALDYNEPP